MNNLLIVLTGKTAAGKDTVMLELLSKFPNLKRVITTTSRTMRSSEKDGIDYHFISKEAFLEKIEEENFIEYVQYAGNFYGTEKAQITNNLDQKLIWRIDPSRAGQIKELLEKSFDQKTAKDLLNKLLVIYLTVSDNVILKRLNERNLTQEEINKRMQEDKNFWEQFKDKYDFVIENTPGKLAETVDKIVKIIENRRSS